MAETVNGGSLDPIDAQLDGAPDRCDRLLVVLLPPAEKPAPSPDGPGAQADGGNFDSAASQQPLSKRHAFLSHLGGYFTAATAKVVI